MSSESKKRRPRILSFEEARERLEGIWNTLAELPHRALVRFREEMASHLIAPSSGFRATALHDIVIDEMRKLIPDQVFFGRGRWLVRAKDLVLQFKLVDAAGRTSNIEKGRRATKAAMEFGTQLKLPGIPNATRLTLGYRPNDEATEMIDVKLIARDGDRILWAVPVTETPQMTLQPIVDAVTAPPVQKKRLSAKVEATAARGKKKIKKPSGE